MRTFWVRTAMTLLLASGGCLTAGDLTAGSEKAGPVPDPLQQGRYLVRIAGCNDCHTAGYARSGGRVPDSQWLTGEALGWRGPWGTTYPVNLRLYMQNLSEDEWVVRARTMRTRPPMPWFTLQAMTDADLRAIYRFIRHLGPAGQEAPAYLPPGIAPPTPYVLFPAPPDQGEAPR